MSANTFEMSTDMSDLCRVCLQLPEKSQYLDLTTIYDEEDNLTYAECFTICTQIDLNDGEGVPHHLCKSCGIELQMSYDFHKKIEESKRVIQQCQRQRKVQTLNNSELLSKNENDESIILNEQKKNSVVRLMDSKCINSEEEMQLSDPSEPQQQSEIAESSEANDDSEEVEILNLCVSETDLQYEDSTDDRHSNAEISENFDDHFEIEALEEEETETLQIKCGENTISIEEQIYKSLEREEKTEFVEIAENMSEEKSTEDLKEDIDVVYIQELIEKDSDDQAAWEENVVVVANKEHLPIEMDDIEDEEETFFIDNKDHIIINDSSQDEALENFEEEEEIDLNIEITEVKENSKKHGAERKRHTGTYSCDYCHRVYPNYSRMKAHRRCHESNRPKFSCAQCGRVYATKQARDCHIQTAHDKSGFTCNICDKVFAIRKSLEIHVRYHTGDFPFACTLCDKKFAQACHLTTHINVKHNQIRFSCKYPNCEKFFTSSSSLRNHEYTHGNMPFECEYCEQGYPAKSKLRIHIQHLPSLTAKQECINDEINIIGETIINTTITSMIPNGIRLPIPPGPPFVCELCGHNSKSKNLLSSHRHRKHRQKLLPYQCGKCDKSFKSKESCDKHRKRLSCERYPEFKCEYCEKKIIGSANYEIHLRFHKKIYPFKCQDCDKEFMLAVHLKEHVQTKHESKRYICEVMNCGKLFQSQQALKTHLYLHLGSMPFCCEYCKKMFSFRSKLRHHIQSTHGLEANSKDLDRMLVAEEINFKFQVKPVEFLSFKQ